MIVHGGKRLFEFSMNFAILKITLMRAADVHDIVKPGRTVYIQRAKTLLVQVRSSSLDFSTPLQMKSDFDLLGALAPWSVCQWLRRGLQPNRYNFISHLFLNVPQNS